MKKHLIDHIKHKQLVSDSTLHVIAVISNPMRFHSRYRIFREWYEHMINTPHVNLIVVETAFGDRKHEVTQENNPNHLQLRTMQELWQKESMINLGVRLLPRDWKYVAWVDADVFFRDEDWAIETIHALQHYDVVQPWSECIDLGPRGNAMSLFRSFCSLASKDTKMQARPDDPYPYGHSGFAWACTRRFWEETHGLIDFAILGSADHHMAWALIGEVEKSVHGHSHEEFKQRCKDWQRLAYGVTKGNLGYVPGRLEHHFHGPKAKRKYRERWQILVKHQYSPLQDLGHDDQGLVYLKGKPELQADIIKYMHGRSEDSIEET